MDAVKIIIHGALGKMGKELISDLFKEPSLKIVGAVDKMATEKSLLLPDGSTKVLLSTSLEEVIAATKPDLVIDFSNAQATLPAVRIATKMGVNMVIGTTGQSQDDINEIGRLASASKVGVVMAANFALGAVVMMHIAKIAAKYLDYAEIIEMHHQTKLDAPSGTALATAREMAEARGKPFLRPEQEKAQPSRGQQVDGVTIHSVRLPGLVAHQEIILGTVGQTLTIRHDTIGRECYIPGILLAIKEAVKRQGFTYGLDAILNL